MHNDKRSWVAELIASRGDAAAARARLDAASARAAELEPWLHAFTFLPAHEATPLDATLPLAGLPVAVKDLIDTHDMPTTYGSPIYAGHRPKQDAWIVAKIREYGGTVFGKTVTTEFAWRHPGPTVNPWNPRHTPGGSSSGSAAAVGAGVVPLAIGTQTLGSVIRPAAYCGAVGYKPTHGRVPKTGAHELAGSLDHIGFFAPSVEGVALAHALFVEQKPAALASPGAWADYFPLRKPARLGVLRTPFQALVSRDQQRNFDAALASLRAAGTTLVEFEYGADLAKMVDALQVILRVEAFRAIGPETAACRELVSEPMRAMFAAAEATSDAEYADARAFQAQVAADSKALLQGCDALLTIPAPDGAPEGLGFTGDGTFCAPWSLQGAPAVSIPSGWTEAGLPLGVQVVGARDEDWQTLQAAAWVESVLAVPPRAVPAPR